MIVHTTFVIQRQGTQISRVKPAQFEKSMQICGLNKTIAPHQLSGLSHKHNTQNNMNADHIHLFI